ncbi:hypothetical protein [Agrobacterium leguminum]|uniref:hypothetical protein n=1 Tax=Agrobacterium leguminum TaxID=2792015 RepID=UPI003CE4E559
MSANDENSPTAPTLDEIISRLDKLAEQARGLVEPVSAEGQLESSDNRDKPLVSPREFSEGDPKTESDVSDQ